MQTELVKGQSLPQCKLFAVCMRGLCAVCMRFVVLLTASSRVMAPPAVLGNELLGREKDDDNIAMTKN